MKTVLFVFFAGAPLFVFIIFTLLYLLGVSDKFIEKYIMPILGIWVVLVVGTVFIYNLFFSNSVPFYHQPF